FAAHRKEYPGSLHRCGVGEDKAARIEVECGQVHLAGQPSASIAPLQPPGDHQMDNDEQLIFHLKNDPLAQPIKPNDVLSAKLIRTRTYSPKYKWAAKPDTVQRLAHNPRRQCVKITKDVRQLR